MGTSFQMNTTGLVQACARLLRQQPRNVDLIEVCSALSVYIRNEAELSSNASAEAARSIGVCPKCNVAAEKARARLKKHREARHVGKVRDAESTGVDGGNETSAGGPAGQS